METQRQQLFTSELCKKTGQSTTPLLEHIKTTQALGYKQTTKAKAKD